MKLGINDFKINPNKPYTRKETAELIGASETMLYRLMQDGKIKPSWYNNTRPVFLGKVILEYRERNRR